MNELAEFWSKLRGPIHPADEEYFRLNPDIDTLFQKGFVPSAFFGDLLKAKVILCFGNGGSEDDQEYYRNPALQSALLAHIRMPGPINPSRFFTYFLSQEFSKWISSGDAVFVNAVAYRSVNMDALTPENTKNIPSVKVARRWIREMCDRAKHGERMIVFHRWRLWGVARGALEKQNVIFSKNPASPYLSETVASTVRAYLTS